MSSGWRGYVPLPLIARTEQRTRAQLRTSRIRLHWSVRCHDSLLNDGGLRATNALGSLRGRLTIVAAASSAGTRGSGLMRVHAHCGEWRSQGLETEIEERLQTEA